MGTTTRSQKRSLNSTDEKEVLPTNKKTKKQKLSGEGAESGGSRKQPKRAAACSQLKETHVSLNEDGSLIELKPSTIANEETLAIRLTQADTDPADGLPVRRLTNFSVHDVNGDLLPLEMVESGRFEVYVSGIIMPLSELTIKQKNSRVECSGFGSVKACKISGYQGGSAVIQLVTELAEYNCAKPSVKYKKLFNHYFEKACVCVEIFKNLSRSFGDNYELTLDELVAGTLRSLKGSTLLGAYAKDFIVSHGEFICKQIEALEMTRWRNGKKIADSPVLLALKDEIHNRGVVNPVNFHHNSFIRIDEGKQSEDIGAKVAKLWQEIEYWDTIRGQQKINASGPKSNSVYIKINEDEIANDYPLPAYYNHSAEEIDEYIAVDSDEVLDTQDLPRRMLHNWSLYNSDSRFVSLELLPMKPCESIDVTIFGSGYMTEDDGSGFCLDNDAEHSHHYIAGGVENMGLPIFLSDIKEWVIEFGPAIIFVSIRTDLAWYRLGKPSRQYAPWYQPVLKTAKLAMDIITCLHEQSRVSKLSFADVMKKLLDLKRNQPIFTDLDAVERYVVVHGAIILQLFTEYPDKQFKNCAFLMGLVHKMESRHHCKWIVKRRDISRKCNTSNLNPRASMVTELPKLSKRKAMLATTTRLINRIWGEFYSNYSSEVMEASIVQVNEDDPADEQEDTETEGDEVEYVLEDMKASSLVFERSKSRCLSQKIMWDKKSECRTVSGEDMYNRVIVQGEIISVGDAVFLHGNEAEPPICYIEYLFESADRRKLFHGRIMIRGCQTVLGNAANEREVFLTNECNDFELEYVKQIAPVEIRRLPWGHKHRKENAKSDKSDRERANVRERSNLSLEYYCKSLYWPEKGAFLNLPNDLGLGSGICRSCKMKRYETEKQSFEVHTASTGFHYKGNEYHVHDFVYLRPDYFEEKNEAIETYKSGRNIGLKAYVVGQLLDIITSKELHKPDLPSTQIKIQRFFRPEDISSEKAYCSDIREIYYSKETHVVPVELIEGKCDVRRKCDVPSFNTPVVFDHMFFCEHWYDPLKGSLKLLPSNVKLKYSTVKFSNNDASLKGKAKCKEEEIFLAESKGLATLDIFAGCGGLSEGLNQSGIASTKWAIEYEEPAGEAFQLNHPNCSVFVDNCNVILRAVMEKCGDSDDCISTPEAAELAASLSENVINDLPLPGQVDFINGGPPCQGFSGMNRFSQSAWSKVQCEMILAFLSFADYFRPRFFLLENVRNFITFNKGHTFRLTLVSLLEMGYQVRFGILEAGAYGVAQSRKRAFIWAAAPDEILPDWPEPMHVFSVPELKITLSSNSQYAAVRSTVNGAPFRAITVRDTIGDLPSVTNGASNTSMEYGSDPVSWFQKKIRGNKTTVTDHISKEMNELNLIRCQRIPKRPGSDWRDLPEEKIKLSTGQLVDLIPWCLPNTASRHNQWKGLFGRLDWEGNFPTSTTDPQPMGKVGMCFHPEQDRIVTVRECARSQGFPDSYQFAGSIHHKHRQIGNAVPPPLAYALGIKLKEAVEDKKGLLP